MSLIQEAQEAVGRILFLQQANRHHHPDDPHTPEERWDNNLMIAGVKQLWVEKANGVIMVLTPVVAKIWQQAYDRGREDGAIDNAYTKNPYAVLLDEVGSDD